MDAMDAVALGARVQQVADKLLLKADEARAKGNANAAHALSESVNDLRHAAAVLVEQKRLLTVRHADATAAPVIATAPTSSSGDSRMRLRRNSSASSIVSLQSAYDVASVAGSVHQHATSQAQQHHELITRLARVEKMLGKKSDEMKAKGNENAAHALLQSASYVRTGCTFISEQQLSLNALTASHDKLTAQWRALAAALPPQHSRTDSDDSDASDVLERVAALSTELIALRGFLSQAFPAVDNVSDVQALAAALEAERSASATHESEALAAVTTERNDLQTQLSALKKRHAEEYLILREDLAILQSEKKALTQDLVDAERASTERSERELAALQRALDTATATNDALTQRLALQDARVLELDDQVATWRDRFHDEQRKLSDAQAQHVVALESQLETAQRSLDASAAAAAVEASPTHEPSKQAASRSTAHNDALAALRADYDALQSLLRESEASLEAERARVQALERTHADALEALERDHADAREALDADVERLTERLAAADSERANQRRIVEELEQAVDGYRRECHHATSAAAAHEREIERLQTQLTTQDADARLTLKGLETDVETLARCLEQATDASFAAVAQHMEALELPALATLRDVLARHWTSAAAAHDAQLHEATAREGALRASVDAFLVACEALVPQDSDTSSSSSVSERLGHIEHALAALQQTLETERSSAQQQLDDAAAERTASQRALTTADDTVARLELEVAALATERATLAATLERLETERSDGADRADAHARELAALEAQLASVSSEFERYRARSHTALKKVEKRAELLNGMRKANAELTAELAARDDACAAAVAQVEDLRSQLREATQRHAMVSEELAQRTQASADAIATYEAHVRDLEATTEQAERALTAAKAESTAALAEAEAALTAQHEAHDAEVARLTEQVKALEKSVAALTAEMETLRREGAALQQKVEALTTELATLKATAVVSRTDNVERAAAADLERALADAQAASATACAALQAQVRELEAAIARRDATIDELQRQKQEAATTKTSGSRELSKEQDALEDEDAALALALAPAATTTAAAHNDAVRDQAIRELRRQVRELQDQVHAFEEERAARELMQEQAELAQIQAARLALQQQSAHGMARKQRQALVTTFQQQLDTVVQTLESGLDDHARAFRDACAFRDAQQQRKLGSASDSDALPAAAAASASPVYEECRVMKSGVVIKAGASFRLPVVCEAVGWRVVWTFSVKEESADVGFGLSVEAPGAGEAVVVVPSERVNTRSGVFTVDSASDGATLVFAWDNSFSWLNEKTLDYHVSVQQPLSPAQQRVHVHTQSLHTSIDDLRDGLALLTTEAASRAHLARAVEQLRASEATKDTHIMQFQSALADVGTRKSALQQQMEELKSDLSRLLTEQDEIQDDVATLERAWAAAAMERDDAETTVRLADGSQLDALAQTLTADIAALEEQLQTCHDEGNGDRRDGAAEERPETAFALAT